MNNLTTAISDMEKVLYSDNNREEILKKNLYTLLKECIKEKEYNVKVGEININFNPSNIRVKLNTPNINIEISGELEYYDTTVYSPIDYYVFESKKELPGYVPAISVSSEILNIKEQLFHNIIIKPITDDIVIDSYVINATKIENNIATIKIPVNKNDQIINIENYLEMNNLYHANYLFKEDKYIVEPKQVDLKTYDDYKLDITQQRELISTIYKYIIEFYNFYLKNNTTRIN